MDSAPAPIIIKKYANRRLYNTESSSYITLDHLATMTREGREFKVMDARSGEDITRSVLTQIIMDEEQRGETMLPVSFLRQLIALYGHSMQAMVPHYLEASMDALRRNQEQFRDALSGAFKGTPFQPFEAMARQNMAMFQQAASMFTGMAASATKPAETSAPAPAEGGRSAKSAEEELKRLHAQMAELRAKLETLTPKE